MEVWEEIETDPERGSQRLIDEYGNRLYAAASVLCPDLASAEDLVFRTLAQAVRKIAQYRGRAPFFSWLYRIMLNFRRMDCRGKDVELVLAETLPEPPDPGMEDVEGLLAAWMPIPCARPFAASRQCCGRPFCSATLRIAASPRWRIFWMCRREL